MEGPESKTPGRHGAAGQKKEKFASCCVVRQVAERVQLC